MCWPFSFPFKVDWIGSGFYRVLLSSRHVLRAHFLFHGRGEHADGEQAEQGTADDAEDAQRGLEQKRSCPRWQSI